SHDGGLILGVLWGDPGHVDWGKKGPATVGFSGCNWRTWGSPEDCSSWCSPSRLHQIGIAPGWAAAIAGGQRPDPDGYTIPKRGPTRSRVRGLHQFGVRLMGLHQIADSLTTDKTGAWLSKPPAAAETTEEEYRKPRPSWRSTGAERSAKFYAV